MQEYYSSFFWNNNYGPDLMGKILRCCASLEEWGGGLLKDMKVKILNYREEMQKYRSRRDRRGVRLYDEARWNFLKLLEKQEIF